MVHTPDWVMGVSCVQEPVTEVYGNVPVLSAARRSIAKEYEPQPSDHRREALYRRDQSVSIYE